MSTHPLRFHSQVSSILVSCDRVSLSCSLNQLEEITNGADLIISECLDREVACNNQDNSSMEVVREEAVKCQV